MRKLVVALVLFAVVGCGPFTPIAPIVGPILSLGVFWIEGEAHKYYNSDQATVLRATRAALKELDLRITEESVKGDTVSLKAGDKARFKVKVTAVRTATTRVSIRVNTFGDKPYAELVYRHIDNQPGIRQFTSMEELQGAVK